MSLGHLLSLVKPRIVALLSLTGLCGLFAAGGAPVARVGGFLVAGAFVAGGSAALNCWYDRDLDREMERTADRPLPSGELSQEVALAFAVGLLLAGTVVGLASLPPVAVGYMWLGVAAYVGLYTAGLKRRSRLGVVLGGSAGSFPVLAGWTAVRPLEPVALLAAALVFVWTPAHAWALAYVYRDDFAAVEVPTLPAVASVGRTATAVWVAALATVGTAVLLVPVAGGVYAVAVLVGSPPFLVAYRRFYRVRTEPAAVLAFFTSNCYLAVLFLAWAAGGGVSQPSAVTLLVTALATMGLHAWLWRRRPALRGVRASPVDWRAPVEWASAHGWRYGPSRVLVALSNHATRLRDRVLEGSR
ncbi:protoheme IX farnesyltransferase [Halorarius litoreus]|uniref:protoheme IX farnesyltransferase n=1 Tax=Halorarius litoreus TaxID=2962676 RepID=UPI0020CD1E75|nr:protoheme IX farnesyltransferase [Halorarius litoreus]